MVNAEEENNIVAQETAIDEIDTMELADPSAKKRKNRKKQHKCVYFAEEYHERKLKI